MSVFYLVTVYCCIRVRSGRPERQSSSRTPVERRRDCVVRAGDGFQGVDRHSSTHRGADDRVFLFGAFTRAFRTAEGALFGLAATRIDPAVADVGGPSLGGDGIFHGLPPWTYLLNQSVIITEYLRAHHLAEVAGIRLRRVAAALVP